MGRILFDFETFHFQTVNGIVFDHSGNKNQAEWKIFLN